MWGIESEVRKLADWEKEKYQKIIIELVKKEIDFGDDLEAIYQNGWYDGYEDCLSEGCEEDEEDW